MGVKGRRDDDSVYSGLLGRHGVLKGEEKGYNGGRGSRSRGKGAGAESRAEIALSRKSARRYFFKPCLDFLDEPSEQGHDEQQRLGLCSLGAPGVRFGPSSSSYDGRGSVKSRREHHIKSGRQVGVQRRRSTRERSLRCAVES